MKFPLDHTFGNRRLWHAHTGDNLMAPLSK
jgi:hypothetical protein